MKRPIAFSALATFLAAAAAVVIYLGGASPTGERRVEVKESDGQQALVSPCAMDQSEKALFYLTHVRAGYEWRVYQPATDQDVFFLRVNEKPENIFWDEAFTRVRFRVKNRLYEYSWTCRPQLQQEVPIPDEVIEPSVPIGQLRFFDIWVDQRISTWHIATLEVVPSGGSATYLQRLNFE